MHYLQQFVEFKQWGWNVITYSFIGTLILGIVFGWGLYQQIRTIRRLRSGKSIPMAMNVFFAFHFFAFSVYGFRVHSLAIVLNGIFGIMYLKTYLDASRLSDSDGRTKLEYFCILLPISMMFVPTPSVQMSLQFIATSFFLLQSPLEIYTKRDAGSVEPKMLLCFMASGTFWLLFSACISEWPLFIANAFGIIVLGVTLGLWFKYKPVLFRL